MRRRKPPTDRHPAGRALGNNRPTLTPVTSNGDLTNRLVAAGVSPSTAAGLVEEHPSQSIIDALDAANALGRDELRRPAGWIVSAIRESWDLTEVLAERREAEARHRRWERQQAERDLRDLAQERRNAKASSWCAAISDALDEDQLPLAVSHVTEPVAAIERRSVPVCRSQLLAWAVAVHERHPELALAEALEHDLDRGSTPLASLRRELPAPPTVDATDDLHERLEALLDAQPQLARPHQESTARDLPPAQVGISIER